MHRVICGAEKLNAPKMLPASCRQPQAGSLRSPENFLLVLLGLAFRLRLSVGHWLGAFALLAFLLGGRSFHHLRRVHPLYKRHRRSIAPASTELYDAGVASVARDSTWCDGLEQCFH